MRIQKIKKIERRQGRAYDDLEDEFAHLALLGKVFAGDNVVDRFNQNLALQEPAVLQ